MKPVKRSVSLAIAAPHDESKVLIVQRPADDKDLPNAWGLPAATLQTWESWEDAARRAAREKLGVEVTNLRELNYGSTERTGYMLDMKLFSAAMLGEPSVQQERIGVTQYRSWRWGASADLEPAADRGSLCCRLYLDSSK